MIFRHFLPVLAILAPMSANAAGLQIQPGQWQTNGRIISAQIPGMPPAMLESMTSKPQAHSMCLTAEQAARDPRAVFQGNQGRCTYSKFSMANGKLSSVMTCTSQSKDAGTMVTTSTGSYTATSFTTRSTMVGNSAAGAMRMVIESTGRRVGACK